MKCSLLCRYIYRFNTPARVLAVSVYQYRPQLARPSSVLEIVLVGAALFWEADQSLWSGYADEGRRLRPNPGVQRRGTAPNEGVPLASLSRAQIMLTYFTFPVIR